MPGVLSDSAVCFVKFGATSGTVLSPLLYSPYTLQSCPKCVGVWLDTVIRTAFIGLSKATCREGLVVGFLQEDRGFLEVCRGERGEANRAWVFDCFSFCALHTDKVNALRPLVKTVRDAGSTES